MRHWRKLSDKAKYYVRCRVSVLKNGPRVNYTTNCDLRIVNRGQIKKHRKLNSVIIKDKKHRYYIPNEYKK